VNLFDYIESKLAERAREIAERVHRDQKRKSGEPYVTHPIAVADIVKKYKKSKHLDEILAAAYLHDSLEDTSLSEQSIKKAFGDTVYNLVKELTSNKEHINLKGKTEYLINKMTTMSSWALVIKLADRMHNTSDLKTATPEFRKKYIKETKAILDALEAKRDLTEPQKKIVDKIWHNLNINLKYL
jgi:GTP pyrophosphokinase